VEPFDFTQLLDLEAEPAEELRAVAAEILRPGLQALGLGLLPAQDQVKHLLPVDIHHRSPYAGLSPPRASRIISRAEAHRRWTVFVATPSASAAWACVSPRYQSKSMICCSSCGRRSAASGKGAHLSPDS